MITPYGLADYRSVRQTGVEPVYRWKFSDGSYVDATSDHKIQTSLGDWVELRCLQPFHWIECLDGYARFIGPKAAIQQPSVLQTGQVSQACGRLCGQSLRQAHDLPASGGLGIPSWSDPYGHPCASYGRESIKQSDRQLEITDMEGAFVGAHVARENTETKGACRPNTALDSGVAQERGGAGRGI